MSTLEPESIHVTAARTMSKTAGMLDDYERHMRQVLGSEESSIATYLEILRRADRHLAHGVAGSTANELRDWILQPGLAKATQALRRAAVAGFYTFACDPLLPRLDFDPTPMLPTISVSRRPPRLIDEDRIRDLLARAREPYRAWFLLASHLGLRCIELSRLHREHIGRDRTQVWGKGDKTRYVPTHPAVWDLAGRLPDGPVTRRRRVAGRPGEPDWAPMTREQISHRGNYQLQQVLGTDLAMHDLRRYCGTQVYRHQRDIVLAQRFLGHSSPVTTQQYIGIGGDEMREAVNALPDVA